MSTQYFVSTHFGQIERDREFWSSFERLRSKLAKLGYEFVGPETHSSDVQTVQAWFSETADAWIRVFDNRIARVRHLELSAADEEIVQDIADAIRAVLPLDDHATLLHEWAGGVLEAPNTVVKLALSAPDPLPEYSFEVIVDALSDPSAAVRCHAAYAMALHGDPAFEDPLRGRLPLEDDPNTLDIIERALRM